MIEAGFPRRPLADQAHLVADAINSGKLNEKQSSMERRGGVAITYHHRIGHMLKKIAKHQGVEVAFKYPHKLSNLARKSGEKEKLDCTHTKKANWLDCTKEVVYRVPFACGKQYIGQTGECVN